MLKKYLSAYQLFPKLCIFNVNYVQKRNIEVAIIGAANDVGSNLSLLLKSNEKICKLHLYDDDDKVKGFGMELNHLPGGPLVIAYAGDIFLPGAVRSADLIVMVSRLPRKPGNTRAQMIAANAPFVQKICRAVADQNPNALFAISTNPINSIIPLASSLLYKYRRYSPFKVMGITHIDTARSRAFAANALSLNPQYLQLPVIGGHSENTIVPLFSNLKFTYNIITKDCTVNSCQADTFTRLVRKAGTEVVNNKRGSGSANVGLAWSINEFVSSIVGALEGNHVLVNCYSINPHFGTRYFAGPVVVGPNGIIRTCSHFKMNDYESNLLKDAIPSINQDIAMGERYTQLMENVRKS